MGRIYGRPKRRFPWLLFLMLLVSVYAFWILPIQLGPRKVEVEFAPTADAKTQNPKPKT